MDPMLGNFEVWFNEWSILNGDLVNGHLREIFPVFPADLRRYSRWLPLIRQIISMLIFTSAVICAALICGNLRAIFPVFSVNGEWPIVNDENLIILLFQ